ncbi:hypothetical protein [Desulfovibrio piger]|uniref:hypothetical protein n=1 Tax=Desulfovibrio piger TaxID=901 RepID=UPI0039F50BBD
MGDLIAGILVCVVIWWLWRRRKDSAPAPTPPAKPERRFAPLKEKVPPPVDGELHGADLASYVEKIIATRSNVNCVFDMEVNSYMRGYSLQDKKHIRSTMRAISESCSIIRNSKKSATIVSRYDVVVARLKQLVADFGLPEAKNSLEIALEYKAAIFSAAYIKDIAQDIEKIKKLKSHKAKAKYREDALQILDKLILLGHIPAEEIKALNAFLTEY